MRDAEYVILSILVLVVVLMYWVHEHPRPVEPVLQGESS